MTEGICWSLKLPNSVFLSPYTIPSSQAAMFRVFGGYNTD